MLLHSQSTNQLNLNSMYITDTFKRPLKDLRISITDKCNFRCPYCMPKETFGVAYKFLPKHDILTFEEITRLARIFTELGVSKLRITGGEPLLRTNVNQLIEMLTSLDGMNDLALTTNAYLLPKQAHALKEAGLKRITISLDSLDNDVFKHMNGVGFSVDKVLAGISSAKNAGFNPIKINCVVQKGVNEHTIIDLARYCKDNNLILRFIEYMDVGNQNQWDYKQVVPSREVVDIIKQELDIEPMNKNYPEEVADRYRYSDGTGEIGFISSVTQPFCGQCSRARLSTDGKLVTCLFAEGGVDLKTPMRSGATDSELIELINKTWSLRTDQYSVERTSGRKATNTNNKIEMFHHFDTKKCMM